eukprot:CAMPEP_0206493132 /NCGR_PEP_ID=MMETSP0324_2-20121206/46712_1 /ASSEMBLY_ACC=CAM_ASM_000836 /TAXON_ID=2866 /ORGANISM="Crypthecodinium cohnii, Strain Seligo" /LENGTH=52 /DNA_ID=CAMNT_0053976061 /DNA_START=82 /DNA_END=240 /DNA_ORIENTATION=+
MTSGFPAMPFTSLILSPGWTLDSALAPRLYWSMQPPDLTSLTKSVEESWLGA